MSSKKVVIMVFSSALLAGLSVGATAPVSSLNILNYEDYLSKDVVTAFQKKFAVKVNLTYFDSEEAMTARLRAGDKNKFDIVVASTAALPTLAREKLIRPLTLSALPNLKNLGAATDLVLQRFSVPYFFGVTAVAYRKDKVKNFLPTWRVFFDAGLQQGAFAFLADRRPTVGAALAYLGVDWNTTSAPDLAVAQSVLLEAKKRSFGVFDSPKNLDLLKAGKINYALAYNGDTVLAARVNKNIGFLIPTEGAETYEDHMAITIGSPNAKLAHQFLNYLLDAKIAAKNADDTGNATPVEAALAFVKKENQQNPMIYPPYYQREKLNYSRSLDATTNKLFDDVWVAFNKAR